MHMKSYASLALAMLLTGSIPPAFAAAHDSTMEAALGNAKVSLADAIAAVEAKGTGKVVEVSLDVVNGMPVYNMSLLATDGAEIEATVDAMTGAVTTVPAEQADNEATGGAEDGDQGAEQGEKGEGGEANAGQ